MSDSLLQEAAAAVSIGKDGEPLAKHYQRSRSDRALRGAIHQAQSEPGICVPAAKLDAHPHLLNAANGTLNLETGQLQPHDPADLLTMSAACSYEPGAECPTFDAFLLRNLAGDLDLIGLLQRLAGVALLGRVEAHVLPILYGNGSNGKSRFVEAILHALGDYGMKGSTDLLIQGRRSPGAASPEVADLRGRRLVVVGETGERVSMNLARMKDLTGGDTLTARNLYESPFEFQPSHTLFFHTNHLPRLGDSTEAIRRRICKIEWPVQIPEAERDEQLPAKLEAEAEGILRWMVGGVRQYRAGGLRPPLSVQVASNEYVTSEDGILTFLGEECDQDEALRVLSKPLYEAYKRWAIDNGEEPLTNKAFSLRLERDGYEKRKTKRGAEWLGIDLRGPSEPSDSMVTGDGCDGFSPKFSSRARAVDFVQAPVTRHPNDGKTAPGAKSGEHNPSPAEPNPAPRTPREGPQPVVSGGERLLSDYLAEDDGSAA